MTSLRIRAAGSLVTVAILLAACGTGVEQTASPSSRAEASLTPVPGGPSPVIGPTVGPPSTTDTEFGPIWDALPPSFPIPADAVPTEPQGPASGAYALGMPTSQAQAFVVSGLTAAGWSVDVGSPLEDGTVVIEATGPADGCRTEVRLTPRSGTVSMSVLYAASCPFS